MAKPLIVTLTPQEKEALAKVRDHHEKAYVRERASAILKVSEGASGHQVAQKGLLKVRDPDSVYEWIHRYQNEGLSGLLIREGRGRKPSFSPYGR